MIKVFTARPVKSILICSIRLIGDVILAIPLIGLLKDAYPESFIDVLTASGTGSFLERDPRVRYTLTVPSNQIQNNKPGNVKYTSLPQLYRNYDIAVTMNASDRGNLAVICAGREVRIGFYENNGFLKSLWKKMFLSFPLYYDTTVHVIMYARHIAEACNIEVKKLEVTVYWDESDSRKVEESLETLGDKKHYFVIHPFARWEYKYWDMHAFVRLSDLVADQFGLTPVWTSSPDPTECNWLMTYSASCTIKPELIPGSFSLNQMACLIAGAKIYIGLDTAVTHIAASTGVPVVALYGPTETHRWFPWNNSGALDQLQKCKRGVHRNGRIVLIQKECQHPNCIRPGCRNPCMKRISVDEVFLEVERFLKKTTASEIKVGLSDA